MKKMNKTSTEKPLEVLIIGRHQETLARILKTLNVLPVRIDGTTTDEQAFDLLRRNRYDVISIGGGVEAASRTRLKEVLIATMPDIQVIEVPRPDAESMDAFAKKPIPMNGPEELAVILSGILERRTKK
jgi:hypothetical protein